MNWGPPKSNRTNSSGHQNIGGWRQKTVYLCRNIVIDPDQKISIAQSILVGHFLIGESRLFLFINIFSTQQLFHHLSRNLVARKCNFVNPILDPRTKKPRNGSLIYQAEGHGHQAHSIWYWARPSSIQQMGRRSGSSQNISFYHCEKHACVPFPFLRGHFHEL